MLENFTYKIILGSASPRRQELLKTLNLSFEVCPINANEEFPEKLKREEIKKNRYEHKQPGELGHMDLKLLPPIQGQKIIKGQKEYLLTLVDDCTRIAYFTIIQGKINIKLHMV